MSSFVLPLVGFIAQSGVPRAEIETAAAEILFPLGGALEPRPFTFTAYYRGEMGENLVRWWGRACRLADAASLPDWKNAARKLEGVWRASRGGRRVNIDPGYVGLYQMVLATTKALPQAVYMRDGIYALIEFLFFNKSFQPLPWTYADYTEATPEFNRWREEFLTLRRGQA